MPTRLNKIDLTVLTNRSGSDIAKVSADGASADFYKLGATISTAGPTSISGGAGTAISVYDSGRLVTGDTVQKGTSAAGTATVTVTNRTTLNLVLASGTLSLSRGDRLVVTTARPTIYSESTGTLVATGSPTLTANSEGQIDAYSTEPKVDCIVSGGTPSVTATGIYNVLAGYDEARPWVDVRDHGNDLALAYNAVSSGGTIHIPAGVTCTLTGTLAVSKFVRFKGDSAQASKITTSVADPNYHMFEITSGFTMEDLEIDMRATAADVYDCVRVSGFSVNNQSVADVRMSNVYIHDTPRNAIRITEFYESRFERVLVTGAWGDAYYLRITNAGADPDPADLDDPPTGGFTQLDNTHILFIHCRAANCKERGFVVTHGFGIHFWRCTSEALEGRTYGRAANEGLAFHLESCGQSSMVGCHSEGAYTDIFAGSRALQWVYANVCDGFMFHNNSLRTVGGDVGGLQLEPTRAALIETCDGVSIAGNNVVGMNTDGIVVASDCTDVVFSASFQGDATSDDRIDCGQGVYLGRFARVPRYTTANLPAATAAWAGAMAYDTTTDQLKIINNAGAWKVAP